jgi:hypothetical protein
MGHQPEPSLRRSLQVTLLGVVNMAPSNPALKRTIASLAPLGRLLAA